MQLRVRYGDLVCIWIRRNISYRLSSPCLMGLQLKRMLLGSGLIDQSQNMNVAAMQMADMKVWAHRS